MWRMTASRTQHQQKHHTNIFFKCFQLTAFAKFFLRFDFVHVYLCRVPSVVLRLFSLYFRFSGCCIAIEWNSLLSLSISLQYVMNNWWRRHIKRNEKVSVLRSRIHSDWAGAGQRRKGNVETILSFADKVLPANGFSEFVMGCVCIGLEKVEKEKWREWGDVQLITD